MTTLTTTLVNAPLAPLLDRLFKEADEATASDATLLSRTFGRGSRAPHAQQDRLPRVLLALQRHPARHFANTGALLYTLARSSRARTIVEFGTSFGISTLHLAAALRDNGGGRLITTEFEPSKVARGSATTRRPAGSSISWTFERAMRL